MLLRNSFTWITLSIKVYHVLIVAVISILIRAVLQIYWGYRSDHRLFLLQGFLPERCQCFKNWTSLRQITQGGAHPPLRDTEYLWHSSCLTSSSRTSLLKKENSVTWKVTVGGLRWCNYLDGIITRTSTLLTNHQD